MTIHIPNAQARQLILHLQGLSVAPRCKLDDTSLYKLIEQLGYVQLDSIQWLERAHHQILFSRNQTYQPEQLARLLTQQRLVFENWTHDAAVIPSEFFPYWRHRFRRNADKLAAQFKRWQGAGYQSHCQAMLDRIKATGPLRARDLKRPSKEKQEMWQWHDGKAALEYLWLNGQLCITERQGFQKVYDLIEHGIPAEHYQRQVDEAEFIHWACSEALQRLGIASVGEIVDFWKMLTPQEVRGWLATQSSESVQRVEVMGHPRVAKAQRQRELFARADIHNVLDELPNMPPRIRLLSPFDPVVRNRDRLSWLFGFDYRIEIYVPEAKRQWGYYVLPILERDKIIGRIDCRAQRKDNAFTVKAVWWEPGVKASVARLQRLQAELQRQARFCGVATLHGLTDDMAP